VASLLSLTLIQKLFAVAIVTVVLLFVEVSLVSDMQQCSTMICVEL
jgi:hypothetical protein